MPINIYVRINHQPGLFPIRDFAASHFPVFRFCRLRPGQRWQKVS
jgi:hypothetical protein